MRGLSSHGCKGMLLKVEGRCLAMRSLALAEDGVNVHMGKKPLRYLCSCIISALSLYHFLLHRKVFQVKWTRYPDQCSNKR